MEFARNRQIIVIFQSLILTFKKIGKLVWGRTNKFYGTLLIHIAYLADEIKLLILSIKGSELFLQRSRSLLVRNGTDVLNLNCCLIVLQL